VADATKEKSMNAKTKTHPRSAAKGKQRKGSKIKPSKLSNHIHQNLITKSSETPTVGDFYPKWQREIGLQWRPGHKDGVQQIFDAHLLPRFGDRELSSISREEILDFRADLHETGGPQGLGLSNARINKVMGVFSQMVTEASIRYGFDSPFEGINRLKHSVAEVLPLSIQEAMRVIHAIHPRFGPYITVRIFTGTRTGEIDGLKWRNVDFDRKLIQIREIFSAGREGAGAKTKASVRDIPFIGPVEAELRALKKPGMKDSDPVFTMLGGTRMDAKNFTNRIWNPTLASLGLAKRRPYNTRHTFACMMLASGESPEYVAKLLGHTTTQMLFSIYSKYIPNQRGRDGGAFQQFLDRNLDPDPA
jgi:integrase